MLAIAAVAAISSWLTTQHEIIVAQRAPQAASTSTAKSGPEEAFAARFATAYLTYQAGQTAQYRTALEPYVAENVDPGQLWDGNGTSSVQEALPTGVHPQGGGIDQVNVAVLLGGGGAHWTYLGVDVASQGGSFVVVSPPALLPTPGKLAWTQPTGAVTDPVLSSGLKGQMTAFFTAYAASDWAQLGYYTTPGAGIGGLGGAVKFSDLSLTVNAGGQQRTALAKVTWQAGDSHLQEEYRLTLTEQSGKWLVSNLAPAGGQ